MMPNSRPILLVEDDCVDMMAAQRALKDLQVQNPLAYVGNGEEALAYLRGPGHETPCVILLDLNMPKLNGIEFLRIIKADETLKAIPVVVVTTSVEKQDVAETFRLGTAAYIVKCFDYGEFREGMRAIEPYLTGARPAERPEPALLGTGEPFPDRHGGYL